MSASVPSSTADVVVTGPHVEGQEAVLTAEALAFVGLLQRTFGARRDELLARRAVRRQEISDLAAAGEPLGAAPGAPDVRGGDWQVAPAPAALLDRRVEITGPTEPKMAINALNSGAKVWLADLEDANTPHWRNVVEGQATLAAAALGTLAFTSPQGKSYALRTDAPLAVVVARPRGWHLTEEHLHVDGAPTVGALVDFGLHFFHNAKQLLANGHGPYYYLPKMESHLEARLWNDVFTLAERELGIEHGTVRATVLIETLPASLELEEILYELREHASGLNAGRWDYLFSIIKTLRDAGPDYVLPDRGSVTMTAPFMRSYTELLVRVCHSHGAFAMGGMAAFIPSRRDPEVNERALAQVRADKTREASDGFDGSWVAHPDLVPVCAEVFDAVLGDAPNQLDRKREDVDVEAARTGLTVLTGLDAVPTEKGLRTNVEVALLYLEAWMGGSGAVAIHNLMEDAATAEICRSQVWQWIRQGTVLDSGVTVTREYVAQVLEEEYESIVEATGALPTPNLAAAKQLFGEVSLAEDFPDFLTLSGYALVVAGERA